MVYSTEHRVFLVETYTKKSSYRICRHKFHQKFPDVNVPSKSMIERLVKKFRSTGSVLDKKKKRKRSILTAEKLDEIGASLKSSPRKSLTQLAVQYGVSLGSAHTATKLLKFRYFGTKVAVVTGGNKGIGYSIVKGLCEKYSGIVYLTARDFTRGEAAVAELKKLGLMPKFHRLDVSDQKSLDTFFDYVKKEYGGIDVLVNAAVSCKNVASEPFGEQAQNILHANYFSMLNTCHMLFPLLRPHARVVNLTSSDGHLATIPGEELRKKLSSPALTEEQLSDLMKQFIDSARRGKHQQEGWPNSAYSVSRVAVSALSFIQQRAFDADPWKDLIVNAVHPGYMDTDMTSHTGPLTIEQGADAPVYLALLPRNVKSPRGAYIWCNRDIVDWVRGPYPGPY